MATRRFGTLDGLRGTAAFVVLIGHLAGPFSRVVPHGYLAVDLFFLMSGFVVAGAYEVHLKSNWTIVDFATARLKRLWPLYALSFVVGLTCYAISRTLKPADNFLFPSLPLGSVVATGLLFVPQIVRYGGGALFPLDPAAWSLSVEIIGNVIYAAVARTLSNSTLKAIAAIAGAGVAIAAFRNDGLNFGVGVSDAVYGYIRFAFSFPLGVLLWRLHASGGLPKLKVPPLLILFTVAVLLSGLAPMAPAYDVVVVLLAFPLILMAGITNEPVSRWSRLFGWAGAVSYPLYILHEPVTGLILTVVPPGPFHVGLLLCLPPVFVGAAALADYWFDRPLQRLLRTVRVPAPSAP